MAQIPSTNLMIGKGQLFFATFATSNPTLPAQGYLDLGNCPGVSLNVTSESLKHYSSRGGVRTQDADITLSRTIDGSITIESMKPENIAMFFLGATSNLSQAAVASTSETFTGVKLDRWYQLGINSSRPEGYRKVTITTITLAASPNTPLVLGTDYEIDTERGLVRLLPGSTLFTTPHLATGFTTTYAVGAHTRTRVISGETEAVGSLHYHAYNAYGEKLDYFFPNVTLRPNGDLQLISEEFMSFEFSFAANDLGNFKAVIVNGQNV